MDFKEIQELLKLVSKSELTDVLIEQEGFKLRIQRRQPDQIFYGGGNPVPPQAMPVYTPPANQTQTPPQNTSGPATEAPKPETPAASKTIEFKAPFIGTFYRAAGPDKPPFVKVGDEVKKGQKLGVIEAMKLFNDIEADFDGKIIKILVENAQPVEYDQALFLIEPH
jgi:acetyl-CoA carboxylase biotin carboxyl carrier protein